MLIEEKPYSRSLENLKDRADDLPNTPFMAIAKITSLVMLNMRWEAIMVDRNYPVDPWNVVTDLIEDARCQLDSWAAASFIESPLLKSVSLPVSDMEGRHQTLFQKLWVNFNEKDYEERIDRYIYRLQKNSLTGDFVNGKRCIDFGCGHGNFLHAFLREGAAAGLGIDYGSDSIQYATAARDRLGISEKQLEFRVGSVYDTGEPDESFDIAIQNGVFHHLADEDTAYREVHRVLKPGGWFWIYTDGSGAVSHDLWDASVHMLRDIPAETVIQTLDTLNIETNKRYHLGDGLNAVYRHTTYENFIGRLEGYGFGNFQRVTGGFSTDFDHDVVKADSWGEHKFGSGDIRVLAQKI